MAQTIDFGQIVYNRRIAIYLTFIYPKPEPLYPVIFDRHQLPKKNPTYSSKWKIIRAMPEAHYCGKSVGNSSAQIAETIVNTGSLPLRRHFAVAGK